MPGTTGLLVVLPAGSVVLGLLESSHHRQGDFADKDSAALLATQPHLLGGDVTQPIATAKFTGV